MPRPTPTACKLILYNTFARFLEADDYDIGMSADWLTNLLTYIDTSWGTCAEVAINVPSRVGDGVVLGVVREVHPLARDPDDDREHAPAPDLMLDARSSLLELRMPVLVMHRADYGLVPASLGRYVAANVDRAEYVELPGADGALYWEAPDLTLGHIRTFLGRDGTPQ